MAKAARKQQQLEFGDAPPPRKGRGAPPGGGGGGEPLPAPLHEEARRRYLNYALSVITSRALPDVRDGLKPVQRRILYGMYNDLRLTSDAKYQKCAQVVGHIMGRYHAHGDTAIYDALVRMAQDFSLRQPLVDGHGNFGSLDGDCAAAYRDTECRLTPVARDLLKHIKGPDFPTGGLVLHSRAELREIYETGQGGVRMRGEWKVEDLPRGGKQVVITSIPYTVNKSSLVAKLGEIVRERRLAHLVDVRDESTKDVRIVLEIKRDSDPERVMAYLYKHTPLQTNFNVNMTCLVPTGNLEGRTRHRRGL